MTQHRSTSCHRWALCQKIYLNSPSVKPFADYWNSSNYWASSASIIFCFTWTEHTFCTFINASVFLISFLSFSSFILWGTEYGVHFCNVSLVYYNIVLYNCVMFFFAIYWSKSVFESHLSMVTNIIFNAKKSNCGPMVYKLY